MITRVPARALSDIELEESAYKADFELTAKYQDFSQELVRLSLLGIAVYGLLISEISVKDGQPTRFFDAVQRNVFLLAPGVIAFGMAAATALGHRFYSTTCLGYQIAIVRQMKRAENKMPVSQQKEQDGISDIVRLQQEQAAILRRGTFLLGASTILLLTGAVMVSIAFARVLFS